ncbi:MAG: Tad domain-containing protein [Betaproteobacteria bacterium]|nr:Tad domain-containing protein [Betaproteobacteria bacterium]
MEPVRPPRSLFAPTPSGAWGREAGQASVFVVATFGIVLLAAFLVYNTGRQVITKMHMQNTADSAAYSGSVMLARAYNFAAYSNRAMVANQVAIAQLVGLTSWARYYCTIYNAECGDYPSPTGSYGAYEEIVAEFDAYFNGGGTSDVQTVMDSYGPASQTLFDAINTGAGPIITVLDGINKALSDASLAYYDATLVDLGLALANAGPLATIVQANDPNAQVSQFGLGVLTADVAQIKSFVTRYTPLDNQNDPNNRFHQVVVNSLDPFSSGRSSTETPPFPLFAAGSCLGDGDGFFTMGAIYNGSTTLSNDNAMWSAKDAATFLGGGVCIIQVPTPVGDIPVPIPLFGGAYDSNQAYAGSSASANTLYQVPDSTYSGLQPYYDVSNLKAKDWVSPTLTLFLSRAGNTIATTQYAKSAIGAPQGTPQNGNLPVLNMTDADKGSVMASSASSEAYFARPLTAWQLGGQTVYGNLFNPYWEARLVPTSTALQAAAAAVQ